MGGTPGHHLRPFGLDTVGSQPGRVGDSPGEGQPQLTNHSEPCSCIKELCLLCKSVSTQLGCLLLPVQRAVLDNPACSSGSLLSKQSPSLIPLFRKSIKRTLPFPFQVALLRGAKVIPSTLGLAWCLKELWNHRPGTRGKAKITRCLLDAIALGGLGEAC